MTHREIIELLAWYVNATLKKEERRTVEAHLASCRECALQLEGLKTMRAAEVELGEEAPTPSPSLLNRALVEIEAYERERARPRERRFGWFSSLRDQTGGLWASWLPTPAFARVVIAVQLVLVVALGTVVFIQRHRGPVYSILTRPSSQGAGARITVGFSEGISEEAMRQAIQEIHGKIVDGPSALGLYTIEVPIPPERTEEVAKVLQTLRQNRRVIGFAERRL